MKKTLVGDTVARFLEMFGAKIAGGVPTGMVTHYLVGPLFGVLFGGAVTRLSALQGGSKRSQVNPSVAKKALNFGKSRS
jgi:hypothetical protein